MVVMGFYRFSAKVIKRSDGSNSIASAAYRAGVSLTDDRDGTPRDYSDREDVVYTAILAPDNVPQWVKDRERLWNEIEKIERRKDAQLAREIQLNLWIGGGSMNWSEGIIFKYQKAT